MSSIDEITLNFNPFTLNLLNVILGLIVFGVSLDLKIEDFKKIMKAPKPFIIGSFSQFLLLPALTFGLLYIFKPIPSIALGMLLVSACPGGNISNFMTLLAKGNAALSISMSAFSTALATIMTPLNITFWGSINPQTRSLLTEISLDPLRMFFLILVLMLVPLSAGLFLSSKYPDLANKLKKGMKIFSILFFAAFIVFAVVVNFKYFKGHLGYLAMLVISINAAAFIMGYVISWIAGLEEYNRRAVALEVGIQNSGLGLILIFNFFNGLGGMAVIAAFWGVWHIISGLTLATFWSRKKISYA